MICVCVAGFGFGLWERAPMMKVEVFCVTKGETNETENKHATSIIGKQKNLYN